MSAPPSRTPPAAFRPRFTLSLLYLACFFLAFSLLLVLPELLQWDWPADPADDEAAVAELLGIVRHAARPRLPYALLLTLGALFLGVRQGLLPGMGQPSRN